MGFTGQTFDELLSMEEEIKDNLESGDLADPEFHSAILRRMVLHKARARLRELHAALRARSLAQADQKTDVPKAMGWREEVRADSARIRLEMGSISTKVQNIFYSG
jgi:hypothetical protein